MNMQFIRKSWMDRLHTQHTSTSTCNKKAPIAKTTTIGQTIVYYLLLPCGGTHRDRKVGRRQLHNCTTAPLHGCTLFNVSMSRHVSRCFALTTSYHPRYLCMYVMSTYYPPQHNIFDEDTQLWAMGYGLLLLSMGVGGMCSVLFADV